MIITKATGRSWATEVRDRIIVPLGLRHTFVPGAWPCLPAPHAHLYQQFTPGGPLTDTGEQDCWTATASASPGTAVRAAAVTGRTAATSWAPPQPSGISATAGAASWSKHSPNWPASRPPCASTSSKPISSTTHSARGTSSYDGACGLLHLYKVLAIVLCSRRMVRMTCAAQTSLMFVKGVGAVPAEQRRGARD